MISGLVLKYLKGERLVISRGYESPLPAPVSAGDVVGELVIHQGVRDITRRVPLVATGDVAQGGLSVRLRTAANLLMNEVMGPSESGGDAAATDG